jgi:hypothetical protein
MSPAVRALEPLLGRSTRPSGSVAIDEKEDDEPPQQLAAPKRKPAARKAAR